MSLRYKNNNKRNYFLVFLIIASSGIPLFSGNDLLNILLFLYSIIIANFKGIDKDPKAFLIILFFLLIEVSQHFLHGSYSYRTSIGTFIKLSTAYFIIKLVRERFIIYYINILYFFSLISFLFYSLTFIPGFTDIVVNQIAPYFESPFLDSNSFYKPSPSIIFYTFDPIALSDFRNSGPFWEPGAFAVYLIFALLFNIIKEKNLFGKKNLVFMVALISTFSTAGYIAFFIMISGFYFFNKKVSHKLILIIFVSSSISFYSSTSFLEEKVKKNISLADQTTSSRFGSALADYTLFIESPIVGWGRGPKRYGNREVFSFGKDQHRNNGIFILLATYGLLGSLFYFFLFYKSIKVINKFYKYSRGFSLVFFITILLLGFSQSLFFKPFFLCFMFLFLVFKKQKQNVKII
jgi:hypothetical protein